MRRDHDTCEVEAIHEEIVMRVRLSMPEDKNFNDLSNMYKVFADNTRLKILWALSREEMCVCDLAALLCKTTSAISHQLKLLRLANLVKFDKLGKIVYYSLVDSHINNMLQIR